MTGQPLRAMGWMETTCRNLECCGTFVGFAVGLGQGLPLHLGLRRESGYENM